MLDCSEPPLHNYSDSLPPSFPSNLTCHISNRSCLHLRACLLPTLICPCHYCLCVQVCLVMGVDRSTCPLPLLLHPTLVDIPLGTLDMVCILHSACMCVCVSLHMCVHILEVHGVSCVSVCSSLAFLLQHYFEESNQISSVCVNVITSNACLTEFSSLLPWLLSVKFESPTQPVESVLCMCRHC